jgi:N-acetyl sugar amidotransferase
MNKAIKVCTRCVMDTTASNIVFDENGVCTFCKDFLVKVNNVSATHRGNSDLSKLIEKIKKDGKGKDYDCIVGVSGGVDSSYTLIKVIELGLRPLAVHLDNGWNSELAVSNITNLITSLNVDLYTHVIDWQENRDMQLAFMKANVLDIELLMDNAMAALNYNIAKKYNLKHILSGTNTATEGMAAPKDWVHYKFDVKNIKDICNKFGTLKIKSHPLLSTSEYAINTFIRKITWVHFLDYMDYKKKDAINTLIEKVNYKPYPYKHYESVFTRFYQGYILPNKFNVDKRKLHLSTLIMNGEISREEALEHFKVNPYPDPQLLEQDKEYILKKMGLTKFEFDSYISTPRVPHSFYKTEEPFFNMLLRLKKLIN